MAGPTGEVEMDDTMKKKLENFATSYIATIAAKRKRNVEWAKSSVHGKLRDPGRESAGIECD